MGLNQGLFGEGTQGTSAQGQDGYWYPVSDGNLAGQGPNTGLIGADMATNTASQNTPGVNPTIYQNAMNLANAQASNYQDMGNSALGRAAPTINNPNAGAMQGQLASINQGYGALTSGLANTASGGGINAGQAQYAGAQSQGVQAAMQQAAQARGGGMQAALAPASSGFGNQASLAAGARGQQIGIAQQGLASALYGQGGMNMATYGLQNSAAMDQAQLQAAQNAQNNQYAMQLYNLSQSQQQQGINANQQYNTGAIGIANAGTSHQQTQNNQTMQTIGTGLAAGGAMAAAMA